MNETNSGRQLAIIEPAPEQQAPLIKLVALPIIEQRLKTLKPEIERRTAEAMAMVCTEENRAEIKALRATLNKESKDLHDHVMAIVNAAMKPIDDFKKSYKDCAADPYQKADEDLKKKILEVENGIKQACEATVKQFFTDLITAHHLPWLRYESMGIKISLTDAQSKTQPPKKFQTQITQYVESVAADVQTINGMPNSGEIMAEYRQCLNLTRSIQSVNDRHQRIEAAQREQAAREAARAAEKERAAAVRAAAQENSAAPVAPAVPVAVERPAPVITTPATVRCRFEVEGTIDQLTLLKRFMDQNGYNFKDI